MGQNRTGPLVRIRPGPPRRSPVGLGVRDLDSAGFLVAVELRALGFPLEGSFALLFAFLFAPTLVLLVEGAILRS